MSSKQRDWRFELLRIFSMLLIVATHYFASDNWAVHTDPARAGSWAASAHDSLIMTGQIGVTLFVLISAYFLSTSTHSPIPRMIKLWVQVVVYTAGIYNIYIAIIVARGHKPTFLTIRNTLAAVFPVTMGTYWFISAFFVMMALAPFINVLAEHLTKRNFLLLTGITIWVTFIWRILNPLTLQYFTDIGYFVSLYLIGSVIRRYSELIPTIRFWIVFPVILLCFVLCTVGTHIVRSGAHIITELGYPSNLFTAGSGASPIFAVIIGTVIFIWVTQTKPLEHSSILGRIVLAISPATLGVYLIHENFIVKQYLWSFVFRVPEPPSILSKMVIAPMEIITLYIVLLAASWGIHSLIINPLLSILKPKLTKIR